MPPSTEDTTGQLPTLQKKKRRVVGIIWITVAFILIQPVLGGWLPDEIFIIFSGIGSLMLVLGIPVELFILYRLRKRIRQEREIERATSRLHGKKPKGGSEETDESSKKLVALENRLHRAVRIFQISLLLGVPLIVAAIWLLGNNNLAVLVSLLFLMELLTLAGLRNQIRQAKQLPDTFWTPGHIIVILIVLPFVAVIGSIIYQQVEMETVASREHDAIHPGMDLAEVFTAARSWNWAYPYTAEGEHGPMVTSYDGANPHFGDKSYPDWDSLVADLEERENELLPYTRWMFAYRGGAFVKKAYSVYFKDGKVARVTESENYD